MVGEWQGFGRCHHHSLIVTAYPDVAVRCRIDRTDLHPVEIDRRIEESGTSLHLVSPFPDHPKAGVGCYVGVSVLVVTYFVDYSLTHGGCVDLIGFERLCVYAPDPLLPVDHYRVAMLMAYSLDEAV